jgi:hypothetical protein
MAVTTAYMFYKQNVKLQIEMSAKEKELADTKQMVETLATARADDQLSVLNYSKKLTKIEKDYRDAVQNLEKQKQKKAAILRHPNMVSNRVNSASKRMFESLSCISGDLQRCSTDSSATSTTGNGDKP